MHGKIIDTDRGTSDFIVIIIMANVDRTVHDIHVKSHHYDLQLISKLRL